MFCNRCGKTIYSSEDRCKHCGQPVGVSRFLGTAEVAKYSAAQTWEEAPQVERDDMEFTRTSYMSDAQVGVEEEQDVTRSTVYRPVLRETEVQGRTNRSTVPEEEAAEAEEAAQESSAEEPAEEAVQADEARKAENEKAQYAQDGQEAPKPRTQIKLTPVKRTGIRPEVLAHMSDLDENIRRAEEKASRKNAAAAARQAQKEEPEAADEEPDEEIPENESQPRRMPKLNLNIKFPAFGRRAPEEDDEDEDQEEQEELERAAAFAAAQDESEEDDSGEEDDEEEDGESFMDRVKGMAQAGWKKLSRMDRKKHLQMGGIALAVVLVLVVGVLWVGRLTADKSNIDGVTYSVYSRGIQILESHSTQEYFDEILELYNSNFMGVSSRFNTELAEIQALMPEEPGENDQAFIETVYTMQSSLHTTATIYALSQADGAAETLSADFQSEWKKMNNAIATLKASTSAEDLPSIAMASQVSITDQLNEEEQAADEASKYIKLTKGMMNSNDVYLMQERLVELGYMQGECDGSFGSKTELAVKRFQKKVGVETDGIVTPELQVLLFAPDAPRRDGTSSAVPASTPTTAPASQEDTDTQEAAPAPAQEG